MAEQGKAQSVSSKMIFIGWVVGMDITLVQLLSTKCELVSLI